MALAERDSRMAPTSPPASWESIRGHVGWESALALVAIYALLIVGVAFLARRLGLRRKLSWFFALGVASWLVAPFAADSAAGGLLATAGLLTMAVALVTEFLLRRRDHGVGNVG